MQTYFRRSALETAGQLSSRRSLAMILAPLLLTVMTTGCSKEEMQQMVTDVKQGASDLKTSADGAIGKVKETTKSLADASSLTDFSGKGTIKLNSPVEFSSAYIRLIPLNGSTVFQIQSHLQGETERFPSFLIQGETDASSLESLNGKSVPCQIFIQRDNRGDVWSNLNGSPVSVSIQTDGSKIAAGFEHGELISAKTESPVAASGSFDCVEY